ncbi:MAG: class I SAM-dependent methyltransferase [Deltaproteobacteria bacterium]|nr:class I SAM-dependent methyltransferase [Deltaproteobacteria bacterium]
MRQELSCFSSEVNARKLKLLDEYLLPGSCLDIGCGNGLYGGKILEYCSELLQIDVVDRRSPEAKQYPFRIMDARKLDLPAGSYDNVIAFDIIEHLDDDVTFLQQVHRLFRGGGRLIISVPNENDEQPRMMGLTHMHHVDKTHRREYTDESLRALLESSGFKVLEIRPHFNQWILNAGRALAKGNMISKLAAKTLYWQTLFYLWVGIFENRCIADWFCVAQKT